jgi:thiamine biosynthesis lipoprotein
MPCFRVKLIANHKTGERRLKKTLIPYVVIVAVLAALFITVFRPDDGEKKVTRTEFLMDTIVESLIYTEDTKLGEEALTSAYREVSRLESVLDRHTSGSDIAKINEAAGSEPVPVSLNALDVIIRSLEVGELSGGAFDITIAPLIKLWGFGTGDTQIPGEAELAEALAFVDYSQVQVDRGAGTVFLPKAGIELDLGGIAKGFIVDKAVDALRDKGITSAYFDAGGDIRVLGGKPDGAPWLIGIRHPRDRRGIAATVEIRNSAIVTSGDYERYFQVNDERYHHIIDPQSGMPARGLISVTVVATDAFTADAYSTAVFVLGLEQGIALVESLPGVEAILITEDEQVHITSGLEGLVEVLL